MEDNKKKGIKHSLNQNISFTSSSSLYKFFIGIGIIVHIIYVILFFFAQIYPMVIYNILSAVIWTILYTLFKISRLRPILILINAELLTFIGFCVHYIGWKYNFFLYIYIFIPIALLASINYKTKIYSLRIAYVQFIIMIITLVSLFVNGGSAKSVINLSGITETTFSTVSVLHIIFTSLTSFALFMAFITDINVTSKKLDAINHELSFIATHDPLTNLINRRSMGEQFTVAIEKYENKKTPFSLILADIDDFKKVNDIYGHDAGDIVLKRTSKIIMDLVGDKGAICRWGGEEILILVYEDLNGAIKVAEEIRQTIQATSFIFNNTYIKATLTLGLSEYKPDLPINKVVTQADANLYKGKKSTKNCVVA